MDRGMFGYANWGAVLTSKFIVIATCMAIGIGACSSGSTSGESSDSGAVQAGAQVVIGEPGGKPLPAGVTRSGLVKFSERQQIKDDVGLDEMMATGEVVTINPCSTGLVTDTAIGGEVRIRMQSGAHNGKELWTWGEWVSTDEGRCPAETASGGPYIDVSADSFDGIWPLTVEAGTLACSDQAVTFATGGVVYAVNGTAAGRAAASGWEPIDDIWADDPAADLGLKLNMGDLIERGLALC